MWKAEDRLRRYTERQGTPAWGKDYQPAIRATPQEAPRISRATILRSALVNRELHLLSRSETNAAYLALYHPALLDLHEQRVLSPVPVCHPLQGSPAGVGRRFPALPGTIAIAEKLGVVRRHPKVSYCFGDGDHGWVPLPYVGDLLLFLGDSAGPYCVNWNIKLSEADFLRPGPRPPGRVRRRDPDPNIEMRHLIEEGHYGGGEIRSERVTGTQMDVGLIANLRDLFGWHGRPQLASIAQQHEAMGILREGIGEVSPAYVVVRKAAHATKLAEYDVLVVLYQAIWRRELRVDLFRPLLMSKPLRPEDEDPLQRYDSWFRR